MGESIEVSMLDTQVNEKTRMEKRTGRSQLSALDPPPPPQGLKARGGNCPRQSQIPPEKGQALATYLPQVIWLRTGRVHAQRAPDTSLDLWL